MAMVHVKNVQQLLSHGNANARRAALQIIEAALAKADPYRATRAVVRLEGKRLSVADRRFDLNRNRRIFLLGAGKATFPIAKALEDILGNRIHGGIIACKYGQKGNLSRTDLYLAGHPIPDEVGFEASQKALALAASTQSGDIVFACVTGGSSALLPYPVAGISLEDKKAVTRLLLTCGANIVEINAVRKHISQIKGGRLAKAIHPKAQLINLTVSDVIGDPLDYITDPTVPDTSTFEDARATLTKYNLWQKVPASVRRFLRHADPDQETPKGKDLPRSRRQDIVIVKGEAACEGAAEKARALGFNTMILSTMLEGESKELGRAFAAICGEIKRYGRPLAMPCVLIGGGETTVKIEGDAGKGGPNQEFAASAALGIETMANVVIVGLDSDGTDGPTDLAGAMVDGRSAPRARKLGIDLSASLKRHDVSPALEKIGDAIKTGATGTNVNDLKFILAAAHT